MEEFAVSVSHPELVVSVPTKYQPNVKKLALTVLEPIRDTWDKPLKILSGFRSKALNDAVGGSPTSQHLLAEAADVTTTDVRTFFIMLLTQDDEIPLGQVIYYPDRNFCHIAVPGSRYPSPSFFVCLKSKQYTRVSSYAAFLSLCPKL